MYSTITLKMNRSQETVQRESSAQTGWQINGGGNIAVNCTKRIISMDSLENEWRGKYCCKLYSTGMNTMIDSDINRKKEMQSTMTLKIIPLKHVQRES